MIRALCVMFLLASASFAQTKFVPGPLPPHVRSSPRAQTAAPAPQAAASAPSPAPQSAPLPSASTPDAPNAAATPPVPDVPAYEGSLAQGLREMQRLSDAEKNDEALRIGDELLAPNSFLRWKARASAADGWKKTLVELADPVLDALGANGAEPAQRAAVHYARGVVESRAGKSAEAQREFEAVRTLAGPTDLRLDAIYNLGTSDLFEGEAQRAQIPEVNGGKSAPPSAAPNVPVPPNSAAPRQAPAPDALALAKQAYLRARDHFVERLRVDWRDADARANTELAIRRLKELDEIQKKREEQKKQQEKQDDQKQKDKNDKQDKKDDSKKDEKQDKSDKDAKDKQDQDNAKPDDKKDDAKQDQKKPEEKKPDEQKKDQQDEKKPDESKDEKDAQAGEEQEKLLTKEEVMRLFDRLKDIEDKAREMQMQLRHARRAKVKKDW